MPLRTSSFTMMNEYNPIKPNTASTKIIEQQQKSIQIYDFHNSALEKQWC